MYQAARIESSVVLKTCLRKILDKRKGHMVPMATVAWIDINSGATPYTVMKGL
jgi:hypothetical protein